jgi:integrase/recombinase XerD
VRVANMETKMKRRKNTLTSIRGETQPQIQQIKFEDVVKTFLLDCRARNLSDRTIQFYKENLNYLQRTFDNQGLKLSISTITSKELKYHFTGYMQSGFNSLYFSTPTFPFSISPIT